MVYWCVKNVHLYINPLFLNVNAFLFYDFVRGVSFTRGELIPSHLSAFNKIYDEKGIFFFFFFTTHYISTPSKIEYQPTGKTICAERNDLEAYSDQSSTNAIDTFLYLFASRPRTIIHQLKID